MKYILVLTSILVGFSLLSGCLHDSSENTETELEGVWNTGCTYIEETGASKFSFEFFKNELILTMEMWYDQDCTIPFMTVKATGTFTIGSDYIISSEDSVKEINQSRSNWYITLRDKEAVSVHNMLVYCDNSNWEIDSVFEVTICDEFTAAKKVYDIFKIEGSKLFFGESYDEKITTEVTRYDQLNELAYTKMD